MTNFIDLAATRSRIARYTTADLVPIIIAYLDMLDGWQWEKLSSIHKLIVEETENWTVRVDAMGNHTKSIPRMQRIFPIQNDGYYCRMYPFRKEARQGVWHDSGRIYWTNPPRVWRRRKLRSIERYLILHRRFITKISIYFDQRTLGQ